jgi:formate-dependent nitrite reductase membrane component NrfD
MDAAPFTGYVYPNEGVIQWSVLIVIYPYLTGLVAGAFTVSSFYHVFGMQRFKPVARLALLTSLCFMVFVPVPLLAHLGHPERSYYSMITPHLTSAFAMFGFFAAFYMVLLMLECWFVFRKDNVERARNSTGLKRAFYRAVTLWSDDLSPSAHGLHGYIGFVYGSLKARLWWESDLMPVIFLFSAIVSGIALLMVLYVVSCKLRRVLIDHDCLKGMTYALWGFLMFTVVLEGLTFGNLVYKGREGVEVTLADPGVRAGTTVLPLLRAAILCRGAGSDRHDRCYGGLEHPWTDFRDRRHHFGAVGFAECPDDALERGHRRPGNRQVSQGPRKPVHGYAPDAGAVRAAGLAGTAVPAMGGSTAGSVRPVENSGR